MADRHHAALGFVLVVAATAMPSLAEARVQTYQIVRLLSYKTDCQLAHLDEKPSPGGGAMAFFAACDNVTFYPHGIDILCTDRDDEQSCRILTAETRFDQLNLLRKDP